MPETRRLGGTLYQEQTAAGTPPTGYVALYPKSDGLFYSKDDAGVETVVTGGGGSGTPPYTATIGDGTTTSITVTHNLGTKDVNVYAYSLTSPFPEVTVRIEHATTNTVTLIFAVAPATNTVRVMITTGGMGPAGPAGNDGQGVPTGGTAGQLLLKDSGTDFDTSWATVIDDTAYNATSWNGVTTIAPSKNAVRDEIELRAPLASPTFTGTVTLPSDQSLPGNPTTTTQSAGNNSTRIATTAYADTIKAGAMGYVNHGSTAGTARPSGFAAITWYGSVQPTNATAGDIWVDTA
jgi:hypothetical protein